MSKIIVPQELQEKIIDLYVNKQYGRMKIKKELNLPFGDTVIKRILQENNIHIRNYYEAAKVNTSGKIEVKQDIQKEIIKLYNRGYGLDKIVEILHLPFSFDKVRSILKENNVHIRNVQEAAQIKIMPDLRKYKINDEYNFISHNGAWLLGMYMADGYMPITKSAKHRVTLALQRQDENCLELIKKELEYTGPIYQYESSNGYPESSLSFSSFRIREEMEKYGIVNRKTYKEIHIPNIPKEFKIDFIRGFFDGDGSIFEIASEKKIGSSFTSASKIILEEIADFLYQEYGLKKPTIHKQERNMAVYDIRYYKADTLKLGSIFYDNDYISLPRKKNKFFMLRKKYS